jgi:hypothetical protein
MVLAGDGSAFMGFQKAAHPYKGPPALLAGDQVYLLEPLARVVGGELWLYREKKRGTTIFTTTRRVKQHVWQELRS